MVRRDWTSQKPDGEECELVAGGGGGNGDRDLRRCTWSCPNSAGRTDPRTLVRLGTATPARSEPIPGSLVAMGTVVRSCPF